MADRDRSRARRDHESEDDVHAPVDREEVEDIEDLLDEIDSVLEENAEEFVKNYVQKGGE